MSGPGAGKPGTVQVRRQRGVLVALAVLFFAPLALAFFLYYGLGWRPDGRVNRGDLIDPPRPLAMPSLPRVAAGGADAAALSGPDLLKHKWTLLYWGAGNCSARCRLNLYNTHQVRIALGRDMDRVQRVFIAEGACCDMDLVRGQKDLITLRSTPEAAALFAQLHEGDSADRIYLIDPLGNLMMSYAADAEPKGMLEDLKRLLGLSHVG
jgi:cytochrome oxidase Cu insertion factor (SCO1/SenC/PrrC family)